MLRVAVDHPGEGDRARTIAHRARALAERCRVELPDDLALWGLADQRGGGGEKGSQDAASRLTASAAAWALVATMEAELTAGERRLGAHYTPAAVAEHVARAAVPQGAGALSVVDPACGAGALLLAAAERLVALGCDRALVAGQLVFGADVEPLAVAATEAAIALWSGGVAPASGHLVVGDPLLQGASLWPTRSTPAGFGAVVGNPPFQGQLSRATARSGAEADRLRARYGEVVGPYVDTAALFLLLGAELAVPGARVVMVQPQSTVAARDAGPVRAVLAQQARLVELWAPPDHLFAARVHVCVPVLEVGEGDGRSDWSAQVAAARGVPAVTLPARRDRRRSADAGSLLVERAQVVASFRDHYYGLVAHVTEAHDRAEPDVEPPEHPLVTVGLVDVGRCAWGQRPVRFAKQTWDRPVVDVEGVRAGSRRLDGWLDVVLAPKLVVASQTKVLEAAADERGRWVPTTPTISIVPADPTTLDRLVAAVCSPAASAWAATQVAGTALSADAIRVTRSLLEGLPLPTEDRVWDEATEALRARDLVGYAEAATAMHGLPRGQARTIVEWWLPRVRTTWLPAQGLR